ncbi:Clp protease N-terminal domain-containing protein [Micromonospora sp. S-DT3-3-22]|uniref:Clp protease N-terminal domain-containing protein n=1 Tax=Micromonospora sp. S-DT3-3-22 TaxID=2755359 RepID=UPI001890860A|nr:Clp protease N-terminal domain-containing protein [Micromonospora sp. S-DT3-3-22]
MPKINVYLPDALADRVREARLPVSRICQVALTQALDGSDNATHDAPAELALPEQVALTPPPNHHVAAILRQSYDVAAARGAATVETIDVLQAFLDEGESLVLNTVELLGFPVASIQAAVTDEVDARATTGAGHPSAAGAAPTMAAGAHAALAVAASQARAHGSAVTAGSHLLLGLREDPGAAGQVLRRVGVSEAVTPAVLSALFHGFTFGRMNLDRDADSAALRSMMLTLIDRIDQLQQQLAAGR